MADKDKKTLREVSGFSDNSSKDNDWANDNKDCFDEADAARSKWYDDRVENENFYHNIHYTVARGG